MKKNTLKGESGMEKRRSIIINELMLTEITPSYTNTKRGKTVEARANNSEFYEIYTVGETVTIHSEWRTTKQEIAEVERMTGKQFTRLSQLLDNKGLWGKWVS